MVLIQSNEDDESTNDVLDWFYYKNNNNVEIFRHNDVTPIQKISIKINELATLKVDCLGKEITVSPTYRKWYRRGVYKLNNIPIADTGGLGNFFLKLNTIALTEEQLILSAFDNHFSSINKALNNKIDKIEMLIVASTNNLQIPETLISNDSTDIDELVKSHAKVITKAIYNNDFTFIYRGKKIKISLTTQIVTKPIIPGNHREPGVPILFQQYIEKKYELRIFYLKGKFFPMAIFSQENEKTKIDFRNYDDERPNRCVPYILPKEIEQKLHSFMKAIDMNCGSIDMIYTPEGEYVFLEVNPVGQYQWLEKNCNYPISKSIAEELINEK